MNENNSFHKLLINILQDYYSVYNLQPVDASYLITDNMAMEYTKLRPDHAAKEPQKIKTLNDYNGTTVCPTTLEGTFTILLNKTKLLEYAKARNATWVGTIVHETTHVKDFIDFAVLTGAIDYEEIVNTEKETLPFQLWTEFNARTKGYYFVRKYTFIDMFDETQIDDIIKIELPAQERLLFENYHATEDGAQQAYFVSHFLGRLFTLQKIFPTFFTDYWIARMPLFINNKWMSDWYWFLKENNSLESVSAKFDDMLEILSQNFTWI